MTGIAAKNSIVEVWNNTSQPTSGDYLGSKGTGSWTQYPSVTPSFSRNVELLDSTTHIEANSDMSRSRTPGLFDSSLTLDCQLRTGTAQGSDALERTETQFTDGNPAIIRYMPEGDGTGKKVIYGSFFVESIEDGGDVGGLTTVSIALSSTGGITADTLN